MAIESIPSVYRGPCPRPSKEAEVCEEAFTQQDDELPARAYRLRWDGLHRDESPRG